MLRIILNGEEREIPKEMSVMELLKELGIQFREVGLAVAINEEVVPKSEYERRKVKEGDRVEIVHLVGGG